MRDINKVIRGLKKLGFRYVQGEGSRGKLYPKDPSKPFYSIHLDNSGKSFFPLSRFSKRHWQIDLNNL